MASSLRRISSRLLPNLKIHYNAYHSNTGPNSGVESSGAIVVDLRSDVLTKPSEKMKEMMMKATMDDDVFNEDSTVHKLEDMSAELFGKEAALFVPSGTMGNFTSIACQCSHERGLEVILGDKSHLILYEQGGLATIGGVHTRTIPMSPKDGTFDVDKLHEYIRPKDDPHQPWTAVIGVENTMNTLGGKVLPIEFLAKLRSYVKRKHSDIKLHMDGARVLNAAVALNLPPAEIIKYVDTVSVCLSKGVGAPIGSVIAGNKDFIARSLRMRKVLGGGWRKPGMLAAAGICGLEDYDERMTEDHRRAKVLAKAIKENGHGVVDIDLAGVHTNLILVEILKPGLKAVEFCERLAKITEEEEKNTGEKSIVKATPLFKNIFRLCTYTGIEDKHLQTVIQKFNYVANEMATETTLNRKKESGSKGDKDGSKYKNWEPLLYNLSYKN